MASISANGSKGHHKFTLNVSETSTSTSNNTSTISWSFDISAIQNGWDFSKIGSTITIEINGATVYNEYAQRSFGGSGTTTWASGTTTVGHNSDGTKTMTFSFSYSQNSTSSYTPGNASANGSMTLTTIPRYFTSTPTLTLASKTETSATFNWSTSENASRVQYRINNGSWVDVETGINKKSGSFTVNGFNANTSHTIYADFMRYDSGLWAQTKPSVYITTYDYPKPTSINNFVIGSGQCTIGLYNPLGRNVTLDIISNNDGSIIGTYSGTYAGNVVAEFNTEDAIDKQYASIPNTASSTYYARVTYGNSVKTIGNGTYYVDPNQTTPNFENFNYEDTNSLTLNLTGDSSKFVIGKSNIKVSILPQDKAIAKKYATMKEYQLGNDTSNVAAYSDTETVYLEQNAINSNEITIYARDSRLLTKGVTKQLDDVGYTAPVIDIVNAKVTRSNNGVGSQVTLNFEGTFWNKSFGLVTNTIKKLTYKFKKSDSTSEYSNEFDITENIVYNNDVFSYENLIKGDQEDLGFDIAESYNIVVYYEDELTTGTFALILKSGQPSMAIAKNGVAVKAPYNDEIGGAFQVNGDLVIIDGKIVENSGKNGILLYENSSGNDGTISLNDSAANYDTIEIFYRTWDNSYWSSGIRIDTPNGKIADLTYNLASDGTSIMYVRTKNVLISDTTISNSGTRYIAMTINDNTAPDTTNGNCIFITKVIGYNSQTFKIGNKVGY